VLCAVRWFAHVDGFNNANKSGLRRRVPPSACRSLPAFVSLLLWRLRDMRGMFAAASWSVHPQAIVNAMRHALLSRVHH
jgi:hypothetical protein